MTPKFLDTFIRLLGGALAYGAIAVVMFGVWQGTRRKAGRTTGSTGRLLRVWWFYLASTILFFYIGYRGWVPLNWNFPPQTRIWMLIFGSLFYIPGMAFVLWGRIALGGNYFVSTGFGVQLFADHQLVMNGPFAIVRHPMYFGLILASLGALLIYSTWTTLYFVFFAPLMMIRAYREEQALSAEFGDQWQEYCRRVPAFIPRLRKRRQNG
jgi:protein-S-isoprenylcysteine O-methyltransferase